MAFDLYELKYFLERNQEGITYFAVFFLLFTIMFMILRKTFMKDDKEKGFAGIIALVISAIAVWYLSNTEFMAIIQTYAALGVIILFFIPLMIVLAAVHNTNTSSTIRRWIVAGYGVISYIVITSNEIELNDSAWLIGAILLIFVIIFDSTINKIFSKTSTPTSHP